jgi:Family of unknown function (DUF6308)
MNLELASGLVVADPLRRLRAFSAEEYDYYDGIPSDDPNHVGPVDVLATVAMNSFINDAAKVRTVQRGMAERCDPLLTGIPEEADLLEFDLEVVRNLLHEAVQVRQVLVAVATKVLHRKRRSLIPMLDSVVVRHYLPEGPFPPHQDKRRAADAAMPALVAFREDLRTCRDPLSDMCRVLGQEGFVLTSLRALELLIWTEVEPRGYYRKLSGS